MAAARVRQVGSMSPDIQTPMAVRMPMMATVMAISRRVNPRRSRCRERARACGVVMGVACAGEVGVEGSIPRSGGEQSPLLGE